MPWNYQRYGSATDPIHKSHLNAITGDYGCPRAFRYAMDARADRRDGDAERLDVSGKAAAGTAAHETIARALGKPDLLARILKGAGAVGHDQVRVVFADEMAREIGGRDVRWHGEDPAEIERDRVSMIVGVLDELHKRVERVELVEAGFIAPLGDYWLSGHIDLVYRAKGAAPDELAMCDWKTGGTKPHAIELDHGWEAGVYSAAVRGGWFMPREQIRVTKRAGGGVIAECGAHRVEHASKYIAERDVLERALIDVAVAGDERGKLALDLHTFDQFPASIHHVHLADYVPYRKAGDKLVKRPEDLRHYGYTVPTKHKYTAGDARGPAWLPVKLSERDLPRLDSRLRNVVGSIRMGRFIDQVGERCSRCAYADDCLSTGYAPRGDERVATERALRVVGVGGVDDTHTAALSLDD